MTNDNYTREELVFHLVTGHAHMPFEDAIKDFPEEKMNVVFTNGDYTFWHLLEHIRRTQQDILEFIINPNYKDREWPKDYWPGKNKKAKQEDWDQTIQSYLNDRKELKKLILDPKTDLYKKLPHGTGQTIMREILVIVDHNAYHIGEFAIMRQVLNAWGNKHN